MDSQYEMSKRLVTTPTQYWCIWPRHQPVRDACTVAMPFSLRVQQRLGLPVSPGDEGTRLLTDRMGPFGRWCRPAGVVWDRKLQLACRQANVTSTGVARSHNADRMAGGSYSAIS